MANEFDLTNRVALVTGASSGFGAHFSTLLAAHGARVIVAARRVDRLEELVQTISAAGGTAHAVAMDVTDTVSVSNAFKLAEEIYGTVTIVSNNAGVADAGMALDKDEDSWDYVLGANLKGAWRVCMEAARRMIAAGEGGSIVNTASALGIRAAQGQLSYAVSKAGVIQMTQCLALEWARYKIRVNALCPGYFVTEMNEDYLTSSRGQQYLSKTPAGRSGEMDEISSPFLLLASEAGAFMNGVALPVDGAHTVGNI